MPATPADRLLILACSATKASAAGLVPALDRYQGPLWQTLRAADPRAELATVFALSARFGLVRGDRGMPAYEQLMTAQRAAELARNPLCSAWHADELEPHADELGRRWPALAWIQATAKPAAGWREACVVAGRHYLPVAQRIVDDLALFGQLAPSARVTVINGEIGYMRRDLRAWLQAAPAQLAEAA